MNPNAVIDRIAESRRAAPNGREGPIVDIDGCPTGVAALPVASRIARLETRSKEHAIPTQLKLFSTKGSENFSKRPGAPFNDARPEDLSALTVCQGKLLCRPRRARTRPQHLWAAQSDWQLIGHLVWIKTASPFLYKGAGGYALHGLAALTVTSARPPQDGGCLSESRPSCWPTLRSLWRVF
jgi:hypothetical protein